MEKVKSLDKKSNEMYVKGQLRVKEGGIVHIQIPGPEHNREYGVAGDALVPPEIAEWIGSLPAPLNSLHAGSDAKYVPAQFRLFGDYVHIQIESDTPAPGPAGRKYGGAFNIKCVPVWQFLALHGE